MNLVKRFFFNLIIVLNYGIINFNNIYIWIFWVQILFYLAALLGWYFENKKIKIKVLFIPYYFFIMNLSVYLGVMRFIKGKQTVKWERAKRG